jgi:hypothetical protein
MVGSDTNEIPIDCERSKFDGSVHSLKDYRHNQSNDVEEAPKNRFLEITCAEERWQCKKFVCDISDHLKQSPEVTIGIGINFIPPQIGKYLCERTIVVA